MIVVDSSVWIGYLRKAETTAVAAFRELRTVDAIVVGDIVMLEVLKGASDESHALEIERQLRAFEVRRMLDERIAVQCALNYLHLRSNGITIRKTIDLIIDTFCVDSDHTLLHDDRDFDLMKDTLSLRTL